MFQNYCLMLVKIEAVWKIRMFSTCFRNNFYVIRKQMKTTNIYYLKTHYFLFLGTENQKNGLWLSYMFSYFFWRIGKCSKTKSPTHHLCLFVCLSFFFFVCFLVAKCFLFGLRIYPMELYILNQGIHLKLGNLSHKIARNSKPTM